MWNTDSSHTDAVLAQFDDTATIEKLTFLSTLASCSPILIPRQAGTTVLCQTSQSRLYPPCRRLRNLPLIYFPHSTPLWIRIHGVRGLQRYDVYVGWPIAPSYMSPNAGGWGGGGLRGLSQWVQLYVYTGTQINFLDLTPYLIYAWGVDWVPPSYTLFAQKWEYTNTGFLYKET